MDAPILSCNLFLLRSDSGRDAMATKAPPPKLSQRKKTPKPEKTPKPKKSGKSALACADKDDDPEVIASDGVSHSDEIIWYELLGA